MGQPVVSQRAAQPLDADLRSALKWMLERLVGLPPREVRAVASDTYLLFVDGACEPGGPDSSELVTSVGAVLTDQTGRGISCFGFELPSDVVAKWSGGVRHQLVFEAGVLPYRLALEIWESLLRGRHLLVFIDNDAARHSWIKGFADSFFARQMIHSGTMLGSVTGVVTYFCRVPTASNISDGPSRLDFTLCEKIGCRRAHVPLETIRACALG